MLYDKARIFVQGGRGGDGVTSMRREAHVPMGGPDGGDGGRGGDVVLVCDDSQRDLQSFKRKAHYKAPRGRHGEGQQKKGAEGGEMEVAVPPGTIVTGLDGAIHDLVIPGRKVVVARGGAPGRGNRHFRGATRQSPTFHERGLEGQEGWIELQLKLLADVGLVGLPNAGKSSLVSRLTRAAPKIADYPFTTLEPHLGTIDGPERQIIVADIPGLIEGASDGAGLGHDFLAHVERTRLLVHVLDLEPLDGSDPVENFAVIEAELKRHDPRLAGLPRIIALSKADLVVPEKAEEARRRWHAELNPDAVPREEWETEDPLSQIPVIVTSSATRQGLDELTRELFRRVPVRDPSEAMPEAPEHELAEHKVFRPGPKRGFEVARLDEGIYRVSGRVVDDLIARHDLENPDALLHVEHRLKRLGVIAALEDAGFEPGDDVEIGGVVFELDPA